MKIVLTIIIGIHGIIHLFGFLKAFGITEFNEISEPVSKPLGILWLLAFVLFSFSLILYLNHDNWWIIGSIAIVLSQFLIILFWPDSKFGTIINLVILIPIILAFASANFNQRIYSETTKILSNPTSLNANIVTEQMILHLPDPVQNWLKNSGIIGKESIRTVYLEQDLQMMMKPEQKDWNFGNAIQYFTVDPPAFIWTVKLDIKPAITIVGRDKFENGKGEMVIKMFSLIPLVNEKNTEKLNQATLQRYLAEIVWFPSAALSSFITWESVDENSAKATMSINGVKGSGIFYFENNGNFKKFFAMRYKDVEETSEPIEWTVTASRTEVKNGIKIPVELKADWKINTKNWTWLKINIEQIKYKMNRVGKIEFTR